jgi:hypothetical protein
VYLLTCPRFLNYIFSPASFWYLYTADLQLQYVIAEVNNTFDERRIYLAPASNFSSIFQQTFAKDFHVSPFSSRKGSYVLAVNDLVKNGTISVTVTLRSSKGHPKLVARWWSTESAIDPETYPTSSSLWLLASWGWTVPLTCRSSLYQSPTRYGPLISYSSPNPVSSYCTGSGPQTEHLVSSGTKELGYTTTGQLRRSAS